MAIGDIVTIGANAKRVELLASATATNGVPSTTTAGLAVEDLRSALGTTIPQLLTLFIKSTAGSDTMTVTCRLWLMLGTAATDWVPAGTGAATTKGTVNDGAAITESAADRLYHTEPVWGVNHAQRVYLEIVSIGGTATAVAGYLIAELASARAAS